MHFTFHQRTSYYSTVAHHLLPMIHAHQTLEVPGTVISHCVYAKNEGTFISRILDTHNKAFHFATLNLAQKHFGRMGVCHAPLQASCSVSH